MDGKRFNQRKDEGWKESRYHGDGGKDREGEREEEEGEENKKDRIGRKGRDKGREGWEGRLKMERGGGIR